MDTEEQCFGFDDSQIKKIVLDSRKDISDGLFVPLVGERSDGHDYIDMAVKNGAIAVLSSRPVDKLIKSYPHIRFYRVGDTRRALQEIGLFERRSFPGRVVAVTGSVGKTTTRSMIACALSPGLSVFQTEGNQNSQVGVPITLFNMKRSNAEIGVIELGMSEPGEMSRIARIAAADIAVITNIGTAHIENLGTQENILKEKLHILDGMSSGSLLLLNGEDEILSTVDRETLDRFGIAVDKDIKIRYYKRPDTPLRLRVRGEHMQQNAAAALMVAEELGVSREAAISALEGFSGLKGRGEIIETASGVTIIDDSYNASPASMKAGLSVLSEFEGDRKIAVLADMLELGDGAEEMHRDIGELLAALDIDVLFLYGRLASFIGEGVQAAPESKRKKPVISYFEDFLELKNTVRSISHQGDVLFFKGSNSMHLSDIVSCLAEPRK